ncbi:hypothetical protein DSO57_1009789 [Entomophthora muscae]|uniref:Uncharacterized protein n=1 Tax=Entomophthora muscae TaxID=34485 RepID=A0ACC2S8Q9_9FUNG|nr:hypothetical protein DSO57_1009789 [Entomophthora muscae]
MLLLVSSWLLPHYVSYFKRHIAEINHPRFRLLENFEACKAADPAALLPLRRLLDPHLLTASTVSLAVMVHSFQSRSSLKSIWLTTLFQRTCLTPCK